MKFLERFNKNEISKNEQESFKNIANALIFNESFDVNINKENIKLISQEVQEEYIDLYEDVQRKRDEEINKMINSLNSLKTNFGEKLSEDNDTPERKIKEIKEFSFTDEEHIKMSEFEFMKYSNYQNVALDSEVNYYNWGFTPRLSKEVENFNLGSNCFGVTTFVGSLCKKRGLNVDMGITPDHPYAIVHISDGIYAIDGQSEIKKLEGKFENHNNYKVYRTEEKDDIVSNMLLIQDFDQAVIYEILENIEVLRQVSLGNKDIVLPGSYEEGLRIANKNKELLQKVNWRELQRKLFPDITKSFSDHKDEWSREIARVSSERKKSYIETIFMDIAKKAQNETSFKDQEFKEGQKSLGLLFKKNNKEIINFIKNGVSFSDNTPEDIKRFFTYFKLEIDKRNIEIRDGIIDIIENKLIDKNTE